VVQGLLTISLITGQVKVQYFLSGIYNNILFTKDGFVDTKSTKNVFVFVHGSALDHAGGATMPPLT